MAGCVQPPLGTPQLDPLCNLGTVVNSKFAEWADQVTKWFGEAVAAVVKAAVTCWVGVSGPAITSGDPAANIPSETVGFIRDVTQYAAVSVLILMFLVGLITMVVSGEASHGKNIVTMVVQYIVVAGASVGVVGLGITVIDEMSKWVIDRASGGDFASGIGRLIMDTGGLGFILIIIFAILGIIVSGLQVVLLIWRFGAVIALTGVLPMAAALSSTQAGKQAFYKVVGWLVAYVSYKLPAAILYATAFKLIAVGGQYDQDKTLEHITGIALMFLAILALPAMIRLVSPLSAAVASGRGFGAAAMSAAAIALPTGAMMLAGRGGGAAAAGAASGGGGGGGATGAQSTGGGSGPTPGGGGPTGSPGGGGGGSNGGSSPSTPTPSGTTGTSPAGGSSGSSGGGARQPVTSGAVANATRGGRPAAANRWRAPTIGTPGPNDEN